MKELIYFSYLSVYIHLCRWICIYSINRVMNDCKNSLYNTQPQIFERYDIYQSRLKRVSPVNVLYKKLLMQSYLKHIRTFIPYDWTYCISIAIVTKTKLGIPIMWTVRCCDDFVYPALIGSQAIHTVDFILPRARLVCAKCTRAQSSLLFPLYLSAMIGYILNLLIFHEYSFLHPSCSVEH